MRANPEAAAYVDAMRAIAQGPWVEALIYDEMVTEKQAPPAWIEEPMWVTDDELLYRAGDVRAVQQALMEGGLR